MGAEIITQSGTVLAAIGAAAAAMLGGMGSSIGVASAASKGGGVLAEKPHLFGKILVVSALPGSQGIYGMLIAMLILLKVGMIGPEVDVVTNENGQVLLWAGILMGIAGLTSGIFQGKVSAAGVGAIARDESVSGSTIILSALVETYAVLGLVVSLSILSSV